MTVIWVTGLSGAGKSTLCQVIEARLKPAMPELVRIDGDMIRAVFGQSLSYREDDRRIQIQRIQQLAKMLADQGLRVLVAALYAHPELLDWNRQNLAGYFEVYLDAPLSLVKQRDPKGLYAAAESGRTSDVVGVDIPWHAPTDANMVIDATSGESAESMADRVITAVPGLTPARKEYVS